MNTPKRIWLIAIVAGFTAVLLALITVALVIADKPHFGWLVSVGFVTVITSGVIAGALVMLMGSLLLPERRRWEGIVLIVWALIAATSPLFGIMFLLPWGIMALASPIVIWSLARLSRAHGRIPV
jgi:hypothetical protein